MSRSKIKERVLALKIINTINRIALENYSDPIFSVPNKPGTHAGLKNKCVRAVQKILEEK